MMDSRRYYIGTYASTTEFISRRNYEMIAEESAGDFRHEKSSVSFDFDMIDTRCASLCLGIEIIEILPTNYRKYSCPNIRLPADLNIVLPLCYQLCMLLYQELRSEEDENCESHHQDTRATSRRARSGEIYLSVPPDST